MEEKKMGERAIQTYYARGPEDLIEVVLDAPRAAGPPTDPLEPDELAALDEFQGFRGRFSFEGCASGDPIIAFNST